MYLIDVICLWVTFSLLCKLSTLQQNSISGEVFIRELVLPLILRLIHFVLASWVNMLSLLMFGYLNPVFSHICLHKTLTTVLLSLSTFPSSLPNSLPKEKGTSNTSPYPQSPALTDLTTDVSGLDHREEKTGFVDTRALAFWDNKRQRYIRDGEKCFVPSVSGPNNVIKSGPVRSVIDKLNLIHSSVSKSKGGKIANL